MKRTLTIMYFKDHAGKVKTREFSIRGLVLLVSSIILLLILSVTSVVFIIKLYIEKGRLTNDFATLLKEKGLLEIKIKDLESSTGNTKGSSHPVADSATKSQTTKTDSISETKAIKEGGVSHEEVKNDNQISLQNFQIRSMKDTNQLAVAFDIVNNSRSDIAIQGFVFVVGDYGETHYVLPQSAEIKNDMPADFKKGNRFSIKMQKRMEYILPYIMDSPIDRITVFVFSQNGDLLTKKEVNL